jgi:hypothetical protein
MKKRFTSLVLNQGGNCRNNYVMNVSSKPLNPRKNKGYSKTKAIWRRINSVLLVLMVIMTGYLTVAAPANALEGKDVLPVPDFADICKTAIFTDNAQPTDADFFPVNRPTAGKRTGEEEFGYEALRLIGLIGPEGTDEAPKVWKDKGYKDTNDLFSKNRSERCFAASMKLNLWWANAGLNAAKGLTQVNGLMLGYALNSDDPALKKINETIDQIITGKAPGSDVSSGKGLKDTLYIPFLIPVIMLGALYMAYVGLYKRKSTQALHSVVWLVGSAVAGVLLLSQPTMLPYYANKTTSAAGSAVIESVTDGGAAVVTGKDSNICTVDDNDDTKRMVRMSKCLLWQTFVLNTYVDAQFGGKERAEFRADEIPYKVNLGDTEATDSNWALFQIDQLRKNPNASQSDIDRKMENLYSVAAVQVGDPSDRRAGAGTVNYYWMGLMDRSQKVTWLAALGALIALVALLPIALEIKVNQFLLSVGMLALAPVALVGSFPGYGRDVVKRFFGWMLSLVLQTIVLTAVLSGSLVCFMVVLGSDWDYVTKFIILIILAPSILFGKRQLMKLFGFQSAVSSVVDKVRDKATSTATGAAVGAVRAGSPVAGEILSRGTKALASGISNTVSRSSRAEAMQRSTETEFESSSPRTSTSKPPMRVAPNLPDSDVKVVSPGSAKAAVEGSRMRVEEDRNLTQRSRATSDSPAQNIEAAPLPSESTSSSTGSLRSSVGGSSVDTASTEDWVIHDKNISVGSTRDIRAGEGVGEPVVQKNVRNTESPKAVTSNEPKQIVEQPEVKQTEPKRSSSQESKIQALPRKTTPTKVTLPRAAGALPTRIKPPAPGMVRSAAPRN